MHRSIGRGGERNCVAQGDTHAEPLIWLTTAFFRFMTPWLDRRHIPARAWLSMGSHSVDGPFVLRDEWFYSARPFARMAMADEQAVALPPARTRLPFRDQGVPCNSSMTANTSGGRPVQHLGCLKLGPEPARASGGNGNCPSIFLTVISIYMMPLNTHQNRLNHALHLTAAARSGSIDAALWPPSLSSPR